MRSLGDFMHRTVHNLQYTHTHNTSVYRSFHQQTHSVKPVVFRWRDAADYLCLWSLFYTICFLHRGYSWSRSIFTWSLTTVHYCQLNVQNLLLLFHRLWNVWVLSVAVKMWNIVSLSSLNLCVNLLWTDKTSFTPLFLFSGTPFFSLENMKHEDMCYL